MRPINEHCFSHISPFGQSGYALVYRSKNIANKKFLPRSFFAQFVGMQSKITLFCVFVLEKNSIVTCRNLDLNVIKFSSLPNISSLLECISEQRETEATSPVDEQENSADLKKHIFKAFKTITHNFLQVWISNNTIDDPSLPRSCKEACKDPGWCEANEREMNSLICRNNWEPILRETWIRPVLFTWVFKDKMLVADDKTS
ncbi:hypothetical protein BWQ96_07797 [Gracilariopsis chorda]|uniref:Uncharacterized protein n=1 Tax=Gracilariopsis chorda TaxID=448386 RepID=A0A2V3IKB2_9FLOR|nr:hypothetical protein BWQ96_07797 [Gracilariopsis chorda]|eukprot:PXF42488.1 hypothetical protein BWQ96_07797 [Gracilariopsis chorda]